MIKIQQKITVYEVNGKEVLVGEEAEIGVDSHWNRDELIILHIGRQRYTVNANDLEVAITNAQNSGNK